MGDEISKELCKLDDFLCSEAVDEDAMLLSELDGFLAGLIVSPDLIQSSEWLPMVWGEKAPPFDNKDHAQSIIDLIMGHYNDVIRQLDEGRYAPIYDIDRDDSAFWEIWIEGFFQAMCLRPEAWTAFAETEDDDLQRALFVLGRLAELALNSGDPETMEIDADLESLAPDLIAPHVEILHRARLAQANSLLASAKQSFHNIGRNDPCPCGSGKKFKKCCLN